MCNPKGAGPSGANERTIKQELAELREELKRESLPTRRRIREEIRKEMSQEELQRDWDALRSGGGKDGKG